VNVLLDLRPALDGHSGIPQETRLLFRGLGQLDGVKVSGLIQSSNLAIEAGLPLKAGKVLPVAPGADQIGLLSRVVVSLQQGASSGRLEHLRKNLLRLGGPLGAAIKGLFNGKVRLTAFDATHFKDYVWRAFFAKSLPVEDFEAVTSGDFRILRWPTAFVNTVAVATSKLGYAAYPRIDTEGVDVMIAETPYPGRVSNRTRLVVRYHDAIPLLMPHTIKDRGYHRAAHFNALRRNALDGAWFACVSEATRQDLLSVLPEVDARSVTIPNMVSHHFVPEHEPADRVAEIIWSRKNRRAPHEGGAPVAEADFVNGALPYLLMVSTIEPRKNHLALLDAWELLRAKHMPTLNLVIVGSFGWEHEAILQRFTPWLQRGGLHMLHEVPSTDLRLLYRHAQATVCPSFGEGFDFPGVEAMRCGGVVAASDIRVHRDVFGAAAVYFSPYAPAEMAEVIHQLIDPAAQAGREVLVAEGARVAEQYLPERVLPQWQAFLQRVAA
jgi:glycosyltransferase involved in cell wall biosynthesis